MLFNIRRLFIIQ